ncbi:MAG: bifunctional phosphopantothenoylcysteine decarboxylase/phosphopantothenate--cysteine ligase CoaBC, partial [Patescibacteria group bacterium]
MKKTVVIGITSGIAAYKSLALIESLKQAGITVIIIMTKHATQMVNPNDFEKASGNRVFIDLFEKEFDYRKILKTRKVNHIEIADKADLLVIVPATANIIAKFAHGLADDFLTTTTLAVTVPILVCPSMNVNMWNNPLVQENIHKLRTLGFQIIEPEAGMLACGYEGKGRLREATFIRDEVIKRLHNTDVLRGKRVIITSGGTNEKIDDVRFITNRSSGKMGAAIAEACHLRGAEVLLLRSKTAVLPRYLMKEKVFSTAGDLYNLINENIWDCDIFFHVAAVADFQVVKPRIGKISSDKSLTVKLEPQIKILDQLKKMNPDIKLM